MSFNIINLFFIYQNMCLLSKVLTKGPFSNFFFLILLYSLLCFMSISILFIPCFLFVLFLFLVVSGKLKFYWPSSSHRVTVTGTSPPLPIHPLPCPPTTQLPSFTCYWQDTWNRINSAWSMGNLMAKRKVMGCKFSLCFCMMWRVKS